MAYKEHYALLSDALKQLPIRLTTHNGGAFFWLRVPIKQNDILCQYLLEHEIIISPGDLFSTTSLKGYFRLSITHLDSSQIYQVIQVLKNFFITL